MSEDKSNGYDAVAEEFLRVRSSIFGLATLRTWLDSLPRGGSILEVGAGSGVPLTEAIIDDGFEVYAVDASATMVKAFQQRFPDVQIRCEPAESSQFFDRTFDGVLAIGLVFLLAGEQQREVIERMAAVLEPGGRLLFSAPKEMCEWNDSLTGQPSLSLGFDEYTRIIADSGLHLAGTYIDEGDVFYYEAQMPKD
ncbi:MAG: class I SAM-dependent methyltransferase [Pseudomonadota bacterium]